MDLSSLDAVIRVVAMITFIVVVFTALYHGMTGRVAQAVMSLVVCLPMLLLGLLGPTALMEKVSGQITEMASESTTSAAPEPVVETPEPVQEAPKPRDPVDIDWSLLATIAGGVLGAGVLAGVGVRTHSYASAVRTRRRVSKSAEQVRTQRAYAASKRAEELRNAYAAHEADLVAVFNLPALSDVTDAFTARFVEDLHRLDTAPEASDESTTERLEDLVSAAWTSWRAARANAEKVGLGLMGPEEQKKVRRAIDLLRLAMSTSSEAERNTAYQRAITLVQGLVRVPERTLAAVEAATMVAIAARPATSLAKDAKPLLA